MPNECRWACADDALLRSIAKGQPVQRGRNGRKLSVLIRLFGKLGLQWQLLWLVGLVALIGLLRKQGKTAQLSGEKDAALTARFFVGFGAGSEEQLFSGYCARHPGPVARLDQTNPASFSKWGRVSLVQGLYSLGSAILAARRAISMLPVPLVPWRDDFLVFIGMSLSHFAYMRAWCELIKNNKTLNLQELAFIAADSNAFAAAAMQLPIVYLQHGLIFHLVLPDYTRIEALTFEEAAYFKRALPQAEISLSKHPPPLSARQLDGPMLVASMYSEDKYMAQAQPMLQWAKENGIAVAVRQHPRERSEFWPLLAGKFDFSLETPVGSFSETMERLRPRFVVSWFSTALVDCLERGVIPVSMCDDDDAVVADMVYSLFRHCLRWPHDAELIVRLIHDDELYAEVLARLRAVPVEQ